ncbi:MAG: hypothetical protein VB144_06310 [Clostridia bacterium]|nr:hypothetical protein [Clostridia bacterium]
MRRQTLNWVYMLLFPVMPILGFGPFSHPYVNRLALRKAKAKLAADVSEGEGPGPADALVAATGSGGVQPRVNAELLALVLSHEHEFVNAGNAADCVSTYHVLNGIDLYDYAHNYHPDDASGTPVFGYALVDEWNQHRGDYPASHLAIAAGWLAHQIADWYPHYACVGADGTLNPDLCAGADEAMHPNPHAGADGTLDSRPRARADGEPTFAGIANAYTVFGADLPPDLRERYRDANHALFELLIECDVLGRPDGAGLFHTQVNLFDHSGACAGLLTRCSQRFKGHIRIPPEHLPSLERDMNAVILGTGLLVKFLLKACPRLHDEVGGFIDLSVLDLAADAVVDRLFCVGWDRIRELSRPEHADVYDSSLGGDIIGVSSTRLATPGSSLMSVLYWIGSSFGVGVTADSLELLVEEPIEGLLCLAGRVGEAYRALDSVLERFGADLDEIPYRALRRLLGRMGGSPKGKPREATPVLAFLSGLVLGESASLKEAREAMRLGLRPRIVVRGAGQLGEHGAGNGGRECCGCRVGSSEGCEGRECCGCGGMGSGEGSALARMFADGRVEVAAAPAVADAYPPELRRLKSLDPSTLLVRVDGYNIAAEPGIASVRVTGDPSKKLDIVITFERQICPGVHHLFVDIHDNSGAHSEYLDHRVATDVKRVDSWS